MTNTQRTLELINKHPEGLDDDEITKMLGIKQRQQVYQICTRLEAARQIRRESVEQPGKRKKIHNFPAQANRSAATQRSKSHQQPKWQQRLAALVAATEKSEDELLDEALRNLAVKVLERQKGEK